MLPKILRVLEKHGRIVYLNPLLVVPEERKGTRARMGPMAGGCSPPATPPCCLCNRQCWPAMHVPGERAHGCTAHITLHAAAHVPWHQVPAGMLAGLAAAGHWDLETLLIDCRYADDVGAARLVGRLHLQLASRAAGGERAVTGP